MDDIQKTIQTIKDALLRKLGDEVDLVFQYGSQIKGITHIYSDVDISYTPVHETTWECITVLIGETLVDLYPMHWSKLEKMSEFRVVSSSVLLNHRVIYQRTPAAAQRIKALAERLQMLLQPAARSEMLRRAQEIFQTIGYDYYCLQMASRAGSQAGSLQNTHSIVKTVLHCLAACNQACIDTRKLEQVLALPILPPGFPEIVQQAISATEPEALLLATERLLQITRQLLLEEQRRYLRDEPSFSAAFESAYPEFKRDLQGVMLACERQDPFALRTSLLSLYREISLGISQATTGATFSEFNSLAEYEQDLAAYGFPALLPYLKTGDFLQLHRQCLTFDQRLRSFLTDRSVELNQFASMQELGLWLQAS